MWGLQPQMARCCQEQDPIKPSGCPECWERARFASQTLHPSIAEGRPDLLAEWDYPLNTREGWHPDIVTLMSALPIHWIRTDECRLGLPYRWQTRPLGRVCYNHASPFSPGQAVCDCNSLALDCKDASALWDPVLNRDTLDQVAVGSSKVRHWRTPGGQQWQQKICEVVRTCRRHEVSL